MPGGFLRRHGWPAIGKAAWPLKRLNWEAAGWPDTSESGNGKARKRPAAKAATGQVAGKVKATIHLSGEADKRLSVHATMMEMDRSELVEKLDQRSLTRYVVSDRGGEVASGDAAA